MQIEIEEATFWHHVKDIDLILTCIQSFFKIPKSSLSLVFEKKNMQGAPLGVSRLQWWCMSFGVVLRPIHCC